MLPKPKHCGQDWLEMTPTASGRICGKCEKVIVDFSKMSWAEIEARQRQEHYSICGMYSRRQLESWGVDPPTRACTKLTATAALLTSLAASLPALGQTEDIVDKDKIIISGVVVEKMRGRASHPLPVPGATVWLRSSGSDRGSLITCAITDSAGRYQLEVADYRNLGKNPSIEVVNMAYETLRLPLENINKSAVYNLELQESQLELSHFAVEEPAMHRRLWHTIITAPSRFIKKAFRRGGKQ
jgi:hypothetical protein